MAITYDGKIKALEKEKSELDLSFLLSKKQEYSDRMYEILDTNNDLDEYGAKDQLNELRNIRAKIKEIENKIQNNTQLIEDIDKKILFYKDRKNMVKDIPLYRDTDEGIAEIFGSDTLYQYAKETNNKQLVKDMEQRNLTFDKYSKAIEDMYKELFSPTKKKKNKSEEIQAAHKPQILLPEGMSEQINEELKDNKDITPKDIESFLKKELKKNAGEIKLSHINNTFKEKADIAYQYIKRLIINYSGFVIIDNSKKKSTTSGPTRREKLISKVIKPVTDETETYKTEKENERLNKLSKIGEIESTEERVSAYVELYEEVGCKFSDRQKFLEQLTEAIKSQTHIQLENGIRDNLYKIIKLDFKPEKSGGKGYFSYKLSPAFDARRIIAYPNGEFFTICSHDEYEEIISKRAPVDKRRK